LIPVETQCPFGLHVIDVTMREGCIARLDLELKLIVLGYTPIPSKKRESF